MDEDFDWLLGPLVVRVILYTLKERLNLWVV